MGKIIPMQGTAITEAPLKRGPIAKVTSSMQPNVYWGFRAVRYTVLYQYEFSSHTGIPNFPIYQNLWNAEIIDFVALEVEIPLYAQVRSASLRM
jgi:hypothetical protein